LTEAFEAAKRLAFEAYEEGLSAMPWSNLDLEYARQLLGDDISPYGVSKNLPTLEAAARYSHEQGLTRRKFAIGELFAKETLELFG
jgi:4,5-dihydroxyphthalate decarboxylase